MEVYPLCCDDSTLVGIVVIFYECFDDFECSAFLQYSSQQAAMKDWRCC